MIHTLASRAARPFITLQNMHGKSFSTESEVVLVGIGVSPGIVRGPICLSTKVFDPPNREPVPPECVAGELQRFHNALAVTSEQIARLRDRVAIEAGTDDAFIFDAHLLMLEDRTLIDQVEHRIKKDPQRAEGAFYGIMSKYMEVMARMDDEYLRERVADIEDVARRVVRVLRGDVDAACYDHPHILLAREITPSDTAAMDRAKVIGFATESGSHTSHSTIMARSMAIPAIVGLPDITERCDQGQDAVLDGYKGLLILNPTEETIKEYEGVRRKKAALDRHLHGMIDLPAVTPDGQSMVLSANIEFEHEMPDLSEQGAQGVGLYRTEFFFLNRPDLPTEEEQADNYSRVAAAAGPEGVIIRTLDIGGDKLHHLHDGLEESNPFLGWRGIRVSLARPAVFKTQLRAILRASAAGKVRVLFPMVSCLEEVREARAVLQECRDELTREGVAFDVNIETGVMIEVPGAALIADSLAQEVDFFSIGTNDLIQYTLAVDRGNEMVARLYQPCHPGILRLMKNVTEAANRAGIWTGVCGEMAGDILLTPLMVGLGFQELSMAAVQLPKVKFAIRRLPASWCRHLLEQSLKSGDAGHIAELCRAAAIEFFPELVA
jgi:phosphoenolpyruvate-protein phosphotransferase (PTS system enzyme I)